MKETRDLSLLLSYFPLKASVLDVELFPFHINGLEERQKDQVDLTLNYFIFLVKTITSKKIVNRTDNNKQNIQHME